MKTKKQSYTFKIQSLSSKLAVLACALLIQGCLGDATIDGVIPSSSSDSGVGFNNASFNGTAVLSVAADPSGKVYFGGDFTGAHINVATRIAKINTNGTLDSTLDTSTGANNTIFAVASQSDNKVLIGGNFTTYDGSAAIRIARINTDGSLDTTFNTGSGADGAITVIVVQSDGKILIGGNFSTYNGAVANTIARLNTDGSLDAGFNTTVGTNGFVTSIAIQNDGKILIGGLFSTYNGSAANGIARLNTVGTFDATFNSVLGTNNTQVVAVAIQSDGKVLIGGYFSTYNGSAANGVARLNTNGTIDGTFDSSTGTNMNGVRGIAIQSDGKVLIVGGFTAYDGTPANFIARLNTDGSLDIGFDTSVGTNNNIYSIAIQSDDKVLIGGDFTTYNGSAANRITRLNTDGSLDISFDSSVGADALIYDMTIQGDGKILIGGDFAVYGGDPANGIARLNEDGSFDTGFDTTMGTSQVYTIVVQSDGKVLIGGGFTTYNGSAANRVARLNTDGSLDGSFDTSVGSNQQVNSIVIQSDGKIIIGGDFTNYAGCVANSVARLNTDGSCDASFDTTVGANNRVSSAVYQSDGKVLIGGSFTTYEGTAANGIARLNADGSLDTSFVSTVGTDDAVTSIIVQGDGKIIIGGYFTTYDGAAANGIARLNVDGTLDTSFDTSVGANSGVASAALQSNGKIIIGGYFTTYNGAAANRIARLNSDGTLDTSFDTSLGANGAVRAIAIQSDGKVLAGGYFTTFNGSLAYHVVRLKTNGSVDTTN